MEMFTISKGKSVGPTRDNMVVFTMIRRAALFLISGTI